MTWILFKNFTKSSWIWLKEHWQIPFLLFWTLAVWLLTRRNTEAIKEVLETRKQSYDKQIKTLRKLHEEEILAKDGLIEEYQNILSKLEKDFENRNEKLNEDHKDRVKKVLIESRKNPEEIRERIEKEFGFKYVE